MNKSAVTTSQVFSTDTNKERPSVLSEVRAWLVVAVAILAHTVGITWWGATLSATLTSLKDLVLQYQSHYAAIELRVRDLERESTALREQLRALSNNK